MQRLISDRELERMLAKQHELQVDAMELLEQFRSPFSDATLMTQRVMDAIAFMPRLGARTIAAACVYMVEAAAPYILVADDVRTLNHFVRTGDSPTRAHKSAAQFAREVRVDAKELARAMQLLKDCWTQPTAPTRVWMRLVL